MVAYRMLICSFLGLVVLASNGHAQEARSSTVGPPGGHFRGRYIGFRPRYGQVPGATSAKKTTPERSRQEVQDASLATTDDVAQSAFEVADSADPIAGESMAGDTFTDDMMTVDAGGEPYLDDSAYCSPAMACPMDPSVWMRGDFLIWSTKGMHVPALASTSTAGTPQDQAGVLGNLNTSILFGDTKLLDDVRTGGRIIFGFWMDPGHQYGLEFSFLGLGDESSSFAGSGEQFSILARPFQDVVAGVEDSRLIVYPDLIDGSLVIDTTTKFGTGEVLFRRPGIPICGKAVDFYFGYRAAELEDQIGFVENTTSLANPTAGTTFVLNDNFETRNRFHGGEVGARWVGQATPCWTIEMLAKFALGNTESRTKISGQTVVTTPNGDSITQNSGLLAQGTNSGVFESNEISSITEFGISLRRQLDYGWSLSCGYNFLLWTDVLRAGDQIDTGINVSQVPPGTLRGEPRPAYPGLTDDFWAQGLSLGLEFVY